jgi:NodT family efflux transporter outer membrane factor (OMF) lipoprotein
MKAQEAEWAEARLILSTALAQSYFAVTITQKRLDLYQNLVSIKEQKLKLQQELYDACLSSLLDPLLLSEEVKEAQIIAAELEDELQSQIHQINIFRGKGPDAPLILETLPPPVPVSLIPPHLSIDLLARRPDLAAQIWRVEAIAYQVSAAKADFFPSVNLSAFAGLQSLSFSNLFSLSSKTANVEPAIHLPIFTGGELRANLREKKALFDQAVFEYNSLILTAAQQVADLISNIQMSFKQKKSQECSVLDAKKRLELTELNEKNGLVSRFSFLDRQEEMLLQSLKDLNLLYTQYAFHIQLIKALGGGYITPLPIGPSS